MRETANILGVPIDIVTNESAFEKFKSLLRGEKCSVIVTPNSEIVMAASKDERLKGILKESDLCIPDGIGLIYASKIHNLGLTERVTGVDFMYKILSYCNDNDKSIYILGGKVGVAEKACKNIKNKFPNIKIKGFRDGYFKEAEERKIIEKINELKPDVLFVGLGAPKQEIWMNKYKEKLNVKVAMGIGGSIDIWAGTAKRAPEIFQKLGLEWFYRLLKEPWRYKRMMALPKFMLKVIFRNK
ncbi:WecB/TagA/CpsF family glycosyltransferase [Crassaminicella thermophila]|uniref:N-acetylglucosaminyldiphosphoundecaprenol N-acetyl-beta-D-mannosaminyltransferase n=1 Tax=Crassaminicella thermophila TaxID=2599308 RepID=A0A5C0SDW8_CRATE|nr:WecB/TagA/CpsF family glycosyltransferase [Crassaminicella thermophila]QEK11454.1 WecB/TagA/CpsF family glycosyltransferase [Crassaminicella thermophila]